MRRFQAQRAPLYGRAHDFSPHAVAQGKRHDRPIVPRQASAVVAMASVHGIVSLLRSTMRARVCGVVPGGEQAVVALHLHAVVHAERAHRHGEERGVAHRAAAQLHVERRGHLVLGQTLCQGSGAAHADCRARRNERGCGYTGE